MSPAALMRSEARPTSAAGSERLAPDATSSAPLVAHIIHRLGIGGLENGVINLINATPPARYRYAIISMTEADEFGTRLARPVPIACLRRQSGHGLSWHARLWKVLRELRPALVHTHNLGTLEAGVSARLAGVPSHLHGLHGWDVGDLHGTKVTHRWLRRLCDPGVSRYVALSLDLQRWLEERIGIRASRIAHVCNGVNAEAFRPAADALAQRSRLLPPDFARPGAVVCMWVGRMEAVKDPVLMAEGFALAATGAGRDQLRLVMVGTGSLEGEVRSVLTRAGVVDRAWLPGARSDVGELLRAADVYALTSLNEGISNTILEAMASGLPVIATKVGGNPELVRDGQTGQLVPPRNPQALAHALQGYVENAALRRQHAGAARALVLEEFTLERMVGRYLALYDELLAMRRQPRSA